MKVTKYTHACLVLEEQGQRMIIDPGSWTADFGPLENVVGVVVTHNHADHYNAHNLERIRQANPEVQIFGAQEVATDTTTLDVTPVSGGQTVQCGSFTLQFFGEMHALIHASFPPIPHNIGVLVNDSLYYGGDSFTIPTGVQVKALAVPVSAPWLKMAEVVDYVTAIKPQLCVATHNALLSEQGQSIADTQMQMVCQSLSAQYLPLRVGESTEI